MQSVQWFTYHHNNRNYFPWANSFLDVTTVFCCSSLTYWETFAHLITNSFLELIYCKWDKITICSHQLQFRHFSTTLAPSPWVFLHSFLTHWHNLLLGVFLFCSTLPNQILHHRSSFFSFIPTTITHTQYVGPIPAPSFVNLTCSLNSLTHYHRKYGHFN